MSKDIFTKSEDFKEEYSCRVIRVGAVTSIPESKYLGWILVGSDTVVVRKSEISEGDLMFFLKRETVINKDFCYKNNLYMFDKYTMNSNADEVTVVLQEAEKLDGQEKEDKIAEAKRMCGYLNDKSRVRTATLCGVPSAGFLFKIDEILVWKPELKEYFSKHDISEFEGISFDTVAGDLFCKAYVPKVKKPKRRKPKRKTRVERRVEKYFGWLPEKYQYKIVCLFQKPKRKLTKKEKRMKGLKYFLKEHFEWHYDTNPFGDNAWKFKPDTVVTISVKRHGTSNIIGCVLRSYPLPDVDENTKRFNKIVDKFHLPKRFKKPETYEGYGYIYSTRNKIQNKDINPNARVYNDEDVYVEYYEIFKNLDYFQKGMTVYGEIVGYNVGKETGIQTLGKKVYDYGCEIGQNAFMPYRIMTESENGKKYDWNVMDVKEWTEKFLNEHPEYVGKIVPIDILYHGRLGDLYPDLDENNHWHENLILRLKNDKNFHMEENEPLCKNEIPREGLCIRIDNDPKSECFKLKTEKFMDLERRGYDKGKIEDREVLEEYADSGSDDDADDSVEA